MALAVNASNTTTTDGTEQSLATPTASNVYVFDIDAGAMAHGDVLEIRVKKPVLSAGTIRTVWRATIGPAARGELVVTSPPVACPFGCTVTIKRVLGTDRAYPWSLMTLQ